MLLGFITIVTLLIVIGGSYIYLGLIGGVVVFIPLLTSKKRFLHVIALCLGLCLFATSVFLYYKTAYFVSNSVVTEGIVERYAESTDEDDIPGAIIEFETSNGDIILFEDNDAQIPSIGEKLEVIYNPSNPSKARINRWLALWSLPLITFCIGIPASAIATHRLLRHKAHHINLDS
jgi:hypothetical protein